MSPLADAVRLIHSHQLYIAGALGVQAVQLLPEPTRRCNNSTSNRTDCATLLLVNGSGLSLTALSGAKPGC